MRSAERRVSSLRLALLLVLLGCGPHEPRRAGAPPSPATPTHYLDEWFELGDASQTRCRLTAAEPALTELATPSEGLVAEDLHVVSASFACESAGGAAVSVHDLAARMAWVDEARAPHAHSTRTKLSRVKPGQRAPEQLVFEVPEGREGLLRARTYDAKTGEPAGTRELRGARLRVTRAAVSPASGIASSAAASMLGTAAKQADAAPLVIAPWPRLHDRALDAFLDRLARTLATDAPFETLSASPEGHAALASASTLYKRVYERFTPKLLAVRAIENLEGQPRLTLTLESSAAAAPIASFEFELTLHQGEPSIVRQLDLEAAKRALDCAVDKTDFAARAERARAEQKSATFCNALGVLLPLHCGATDPALLADALRIGTRCGNDGELGLDIHEALAAPLDFEVKLRTGRASGSSLDSVPRYAVTIARSGQVRFEGQQWVGARGAHEGRTSDALLSALAGLVARLGWFDRPAAEGARCASSDERGDVLTVRAGGRERSVRDRDGCRGGFSSADLTVLRRAIERVGAVKVWTAPSFSPLERDAEIWVVAAE